MASTPPGKKRPAPTGLSATAQKRVKSQAQNGDIQKTHRTASTPTFQTKCQYFVAHIAVPLGYRSGWNHADEVLARDVRDGADTSAGAATINSNGTSTTPKSSSRATERAETSSFADNSPETLDTAIKSLSTSILNRILIELERMDVEELRAQQEGSRDSVSRLGARFGKLQNQKENNLLATRRDIGEFPARSNDEAVKQDRMGERLASELRAMIQRRLDRIATTTDTFTSDINKIQQELGHLREASTCDEPSSLKDEVTSLKSYQQTLQQEIAKLTADVEKTKRMEEEAPANGTPDDPRIAEIQEAQEATRTQIESLQSRLHTVLQSLKKLLQRAEAGGAVLGATSSATLAAPSSQTQTQQGTPLFGFPSTNGSAHRPVTSSTRDPSSTNSSTQPSNTKEFEAMRAAVQSLEYRFNNITTGDMTAMITHEIMRRNPELQGVHKATTENGRKLEELQGFLERTRGKLATLEEDKLAPIQDTIRSNQIAIGENTANWTQCKNALAELANEFAEHQAAMQKKFEEQKEENDRLRSLVQALGDRPGITPIANQFNQDPFISGHAN